jgi:hypothetical protein
MPAVSVLMAVRNGGAFLEPSIRSIAEQTLSDWELVIVDDASTDASASLAARWAARDPRIRVYTNTVNKGQTAALNEGLALCRAGWVARQDADDVSHPDRLGLQLEFVARHPRTILLGTQGILVDDLGHRVGLLDVPEDAASVSWCSPFLNPFLHTSVLFHRELVANSGGYDESYRISQDYELWTRLASAGHAANLGRRLVSYRQTETSLSSAGRDLAFEEADRISGREAQRWLGRSWTEKEKSLVSDFRKGLKPSLHRDFWRMINALEHEKSSPLPPKLKAAWHLRVAGSGDSVSPSEIMSAFRAAPAFTARWLVERCCAYPS